MKGLFFVALFGFLILAVLGIKQRKLEEQSQRTIPIGRHESHGTNNTNNPAPVK